MNLIIFKKKQLTIKNGMIDLRILRFPNMI